MNDHIEVKDAVKMRTCRRQEQNGVAFEMAYQIRVANDSIRFAIRTIEPPSDVPHVLLETRMQLLDALGRLESAERHFMNLSRNGVQDCTRRESGHKPSGVDL